MLHELGFVQALLSDPIGDLRPGIERFFLHVNGSKHAGMQFVELAHGLQRVKQAL